MEDQDFSEFIQKSNILVVGVGGGGNNTISTLTEKGIQGAVTVAVNTDAKHLGVTKAHEKIMIGKSTTRGLGAGGYPEIGAKAAEESRNALITMLQNIDMVFLTCGLGGGTGTGAGPVIARYAKNSNALCIAVVTLPFKLEGARIVKAEEGLVNLRSVCDTVIVIENQRLLEIAGNQPLKKAFAIADDLIAGMIKGIVETISLPSLVNVDFADVKAVMKSGGVAAIGVGESSSSDRSSEAVLKALNHPLLDVDYTGATGALIQVTGGDVTLEEIELIGEKVREFLSPEAQMVWGARVDPAFGHRLQVITIITGVKSPFILGPANRASPSLGIDVIR